LVTFRDNVQKREKAEEIQAKRSEDRQTPISANNLK